jgi:hypothetical protein
MLNYRIASNRIGDFLSAIKYPLIGDNYVNIRKSM